MKQEDKELLLKDLCARLPYGVKVRDELGRINKLVIGNADLVRLYYNDFSIYSEKKLSFPYLRSLSSMTKEEKEEYCNLQDIFICSSQYPVTDAYAMFDWLNAHHLDYRGLIPKGLALEAPEGMYII